MILDLWLWARQFFFDVKKNAKEKESKTWVIGSIDNSNNMIKKIQQQ